MPAEELPPLDAPTQWLCDRVCSLLRAKPELFAKLYATEEAEALINSFVKGESPLAIFFGSSAKEMTVWAQLDPKYKKKVRARASRVPPHDPPFILVPARR